MAGFRGRFRSRRRFRNSMPGRAPGGRKKVWVTRYFQALTGQNFGNQFVDLFELVAPEDYGDAGSNLERETHHATVVRVVGSLSVDLVIEAPGSNGVLYSAALFTRSRRSVFAQFANDPAEFYIHPESPGDPADNLSLLHPMQWLPERSYSGAFRFNAPSGGQCSDFFADINREEQSVPWYFDITQRRRMQTDDSLWLVCSGTFVCLTGLEENPIVNTVLSRVLIHAD